MFLRISNDPFLRNGAGSTTYYEIGLRYITKGAGVLSRVAESLYWIGRYLERVESVARLVDVNLHLTLDSATDIGDQWEALIDTVGARSLFAARYPAPTRDSVMRFLTFDAENPDSIMACVQRARENARSVRDTISSEMWEQANRFHTFLCDSMASDYALLNSYEFYTEVKMGVHLFDGITDATMSHGDAWRFLRLGKMIERADTTSRILDVKYFILLPAWLGVGSTVDTIQWAALLRSASAMEMYRKRYKSITPAKVADFLILNTEFPRSVCFCLGQVAMFLERLCESTPGPSPSEAESRLKILVHELSSLRIENIIEQGLHEFLDRLRQKLNGIHAAVTAMFFPQCDPGQAATPERSQ